MNVLYYEEMFSLVCSRCISESARAQNLAFNVNSLT